MSSDLLPPGASASERRAAQACARLCDLQVPLRDLWNPYSCPVAFLPYLAWAFSVDAWDEGWRESEKRRAVADAFWIHQRKGSVAAVRRVIENLGYAMTIEEWWQVADPAGTFRLTVDLKEAGISEPMLRELERLIGETKPASRHVSQLTISVGSGGSIYTGVAVVEGDVITVYPPGYEPDDSVYYDAVVNYDGNYHYSGE
ncbi:phage tail protein I [Entomohabitans teleogrylli]|uniref:phage tail protein I n=1 Tax=Entomohabitans teleogrylli TaxID=1384589 RepID=UPI00073D547A|nr:phage tail protein I [Entomohabitans teleogrylli]